MAIPLPENIKNIVWLQTAFLGDIILTTAAMDLVHRLRPNIRQHLITTPIGAAALKNSTFLDSITVFDKRGQSAFAGFRQVYRDLNSKQIARHETVLLLPHRSMRSSLLARYLAFPTVTYRESALSFLATATVTRVAVFHEAARVALLLEPLGFLREDILSVRPRLDPLPLLGTEAYYGIASSDMPLIGIAPGSHWGTKRWPIESFCSMVQSIAEAKRIGVVLLGSAEERQLTSRIAEMKLNVPVWNLAGETNLDDLRRIYPMLRMMISNDSSPIHYASAFNVPTLAIFGSTVPQLGFGPLADGSEVAELADLACRPCSDHGPKTCPLGHFKCMRDLTPEVVASRARQMLTLIN